LHNNPCIATPKSTRDWFCRVWHDRQISTIGTDSSPNSPADSPSAFSGLTRSRWRTVVWRAATSIIGDCYSYIFLERCQKHGVSTVTGHGLSWRPSQRTKRSNAEVVAINRDNTARREAASPAKPANIRGSLIASSRDKTRVASLFLFPPSLSSFVFPLAEVGAAYRRHRPHRIVPRATWYLPEGESPLDAALPRQSHADPRDSVIGLRKRKRRGLDSESATRIENVRNVTFAKSQVKVGGRYGDPAVPRDFGRNPGWGRQRDTSCTFVHL